jgi:hypothetical protein
LALRIAGVTARDLIGGLVIGFAVGSLVEGMASPLPILLRRTLAALAAATVASIAGRIWARHVAQLVGAFVPHHLTRTGVTLGATTVLIALGLAALEPGLIAGAAARQISVHVVYTVAFVPATALIAAIGAFALGLALQGSRLGVRLSLVAGLSAAVAFLLSALTMDTLGWRVGAPRAAERATMLVVTVVGATAAAILAGAAIGYVLARMSWADRSPRAAA